MDRWDSRRSSRSSDEGGYRRNSRSDSEEDYAYRRSQGRDSSGDEHRYTPYGILEFLRLYTAGFGKC